VYLGIDVIQPFVAILRNPRACFGLLIGKETHPFGLGSMSIVYQPYTLDTVMLCNTHTLAHTRACFGLLIGKETHAFGLGSMSIVYQSYTLDAVMLCNTHAH
jgi:hypothetical protein